MASVNEKLFAPHQSITREEFAVAVYNYLSQNGVAFDSVVKSQYKDDAKISEEAKNAVYALQSAGIMIGSGNQFNPEKPLTRAQAAIVFTRVLK